MSITTGRFPAKWFVFIVSVLKNEKLKCPNKYLELYIGQNSDVQVPFYTTTTRLSDINPLGFRFQQKKTTAGNWYPLHTTVTPCPNTGTSPICKETFPASLFCQLNSLKGAYCQQLVAASPKLNRWTRILIWHNSHAKVYILETKRPVQVGAAWSEYALSKFPVKLKKNMGHVFLCLCYLPA